MRKGKKPGMTGSPVKTPVRSLGQKSITSYFLPSPTKTPWKTDPLRSSPRSVPSSSTSTEVSSSMSTSLSSSVVRLADEARLPHPVIPETKDSESLKPVTNGPHGVELIDLVTSSSDEHDSGNESGLEITHEVLKSGVPLVSSPCREESQISEDVPHVCRDVLMEIKREIESDLSPVKRPSQTVNNDPGFVSSEQLQSVESPTEDRMTASDTQNEGTERGLFSSSPGKDKPSETKAEEEKRSDTSEEKTVHYPHPVTDENSTSVNDLTLMEKSENLSESAVVMEMLSQVIDRVSVNDEAELGNKCATSQIDNAEATGEDCGTVHPLVHPQFSCNQKVSETSEEEPPHDSNFSENIRKRKLENNDETNFVVKKEKLDINDKRKLSDTDESEDEGLNVISDNDTDELFPSYLSTGKKKLCISKLKEKINFDAIVADIHNLNEIERINEIDMIEEENDNEKEMDQAAPDESMQLEDFEQFDFVPCHRDIFSAHRFQYHFLESCCINPDDIYLLPFLAYQLSSLDLLSMLAIEKSDKSMVIKKLIFNSSEEVSSKRIIFKFFTSLLNYGLSDELSDKFSVIKFIKEENKENGEGIPVDHQATDYEVTEILINVCEAMTHMLRYSVEKEKEKIENDELMQLVEILCIIILDDSSNELLVSAISDLMFVILLKFQTKFDEKMYETVSSDIVNIIDDFPSILRIFYILPETIVAGSQLKYHLARKCLSLHFTKSEEEFSTDHCHSIIESLLENKNKHKMMKLYFFLNVTDVIALFNTQVNTSMAQETKTLNISNFHDTLIRTEKTFSSIPQSNEEISVLKTLQSLRSKYFAMISAEKKCTNDQS